MSRPVLRGIFLGVLLVAITVSRGGSQPHVPYADCVNFAQRVSSALQTSEMREVAFNDIKDISVNVTCFAQFDPDISSNTLTRFLAEGLNNSKQQSSPSGSAGTTSAVSKPSGSTALIQDVGGFSATNNGSSLTFQFAPGDLVNQLASAGAFDYCTASLRTKNCVSPGLLKILSPATFSVTTNTSTTGTQVTGTAMKSGTPVPATLSTSGNTLTFGGLTAKYGIWYPKNSASSATALTNPANAVAANLGDVTVDLRKCSAYQRWQRVTSIDELRGSFDQSSVLAFILSQYERLYGLIKADSTCKAIQNKLTSALASVSAYHAAIAAQENLESSKIPALGLEYDYTTPASKPAYHTAKLNFTWQTKASCDAQLATATAKALKIAETKPLNPSSAGLSMPSISVGGLRKGSSGNSGAKTSANASAPSPSWTFSASAGADIYNDAQSATIPSQSTDPAFLTVS
jgi:hypothetical protein